MSQLSRFNYNFLQQVSLAPLATFRIVFGIAMLISVVRFYLLGWIELQYIQPLFHFRYFGFQWLPYPNALVIYLLFIGVFLSSIGIILGLFYRISSLLFFICFNYIELLDKAYYLNHYYFVSLISILLVFLPANKNYALDCKIFKQKNDFVPRWTIDILKFQMGIVYFYAGIAKINPDWLLDGMPLKIWLSTHSDIPIIGFLFNFESSAIVMSWLGMLFDVSIVFFMLNSKSRLWAYFAILIFHSFTGYLFQIGVFPLVMSCGMIIFFSDVFHIKLLKILNVNTIKNSYKINYNYLTYSFLIVFIIFQILFPFRYLAYPCKLFWTEQGYRFSWRVMLVEKSGEATFWITNPASGKEMYVINSDYLNDFQEKQMSFQPDMIIEFAHYLQKKYSTQNLKINKIRAEVYVSLQGKPSKLLFDPQLNLCQINDTWENKYWLSCEESLWK